jgi:hypothetical protein
MSSISSQKAVEREESEALIDPCAVSGNHLGTKDRMATFETRAASSKEKEDSFLLDQVLTWVPFFGAVSPSLLNLPYTLQLFLYLFLVQRQKQLFV